MPGSSRYSVPIAPADSTAGRPNDRLTRADAEIAHGILLVGHGTRDAEGTREFFELSEQLSFELRGESVVEPCLLEFQEPTIDQAWQRLMGQGVQRVTVSPLLLFAAGHAKSDIPDEVAQARSGSHEPIGFDVRQCRPISRQACMIDAVRQRLSQALTTSTPTDPGRTAIVMVGRGSRDPCASADMNLLTQTAVIGKDAGGSSLAQRCSIGRGDVLTTFYAMAQPRLPDTLAHVAATGRYDRIIVHPHLLFSGRLYDAIKRQTQEVAESHPKIQFNISDYLGPSKLVAKAIAHRIEQVWSTR